VTAQPARVVVYLLWTEAGTLLGVYAGDHWARVAAQKVHETNPALTVDQRRRRLVWRTGVGGHAIRGGLGVTLSPKRSATGAPPEATLRYRITGEEVLP
jgi:hypothetical protein